MLRRLLPLTAAALLACGADRLTVVMNAQNNSGESGVAELTAEGKNTKVVVKVRRPPTGEEAQQGHIHPGTCGEIGAIYKPLAILVPPASFMPASEVPGELLPDDGGFLVSVTHVDATFDDLTQGDKVINVHDESDFALYVSCGAIQK